jgi:hypothetical protein
VQRLTRNFDRIAPLHFARRKFLYIIRQVQSLAGRVADGF